MVLSVTAVTGLLCCALCRFWVNCGKILAMKLWQALTGMGGGQALSSEFIKGSCDY